MKKEHDDLFHRIAAEVEAEYQMGGLTGGLYEDFAYDIYKRMIRTDLLEACQKAVNIAETYIHDQYDNGRSGEKERMNELEPIRRVIAKYTGDLP